ncbi:xylose ABC transporter ATP-binding protein [Paenibacillus radicis (ex Gao et al. 2016)]|uniref:Xylose import ATP-binding protein XylG n=1 Tax=Paenibacillus radicis (ex Gao et al. 2016) TaxID=1737354 RepID=A0A917HVP5_9BACL|nr:xylose ABC transporter ATP-binding protein [Paenibacillus radicis (ex Gao et al. 2016)]GGG91049.1 xylose import ATP-binding protein XylG [Paenibacillus radicis (ex Gao et al. 2016)]
MTAALEMRNITKEFPGVKALNDVTLTVKKGEVHALCGENGAGKSTLMKVLSGLYPSGSYDGQILINGEVKRFSSIKDAEESGIAIIYQELALAKDLSIAENLYLGKELARFGIINWERVFKESEKWLTEVGLTDVSPETRTGTLGIGKQQQVEIAKALSKKANILILDEPTAALTEQEVEILLSILREFKNRGVTCIYISHKLKEVFSIADSVTVLRDGKTIGTYDVNDINEEQVISLMVGRELKELFPRVEAVPGDVVLKVENYTVMHPDLDRKVIDNISFQVRQGEIFGIAGLMGAGRTELVMSLFGSYPGAAAGRIEIEGKQVKIKHTQHAIRHGMALVSEDRKKFGLVLGMDVKSNVTMASLNQIASGGVIDPNREVIRGNEYIRSLQIKANSVETIVGTLSGGNQQKVVLGKWLMTKPKILILDEPTRGIDVGAKFEIYTIMNELIRQGVAIIMVSSELPELLGMSHRIMVIAEGKRTAEFTAEEATQQAIMTAATGGSGL